LHRRRTPADWRRCGNIALQQRAVLALRDEVLDELLREVDRLADRHAETDEVFGVHGFGSVENGVRSVRTHSECAAVFFFLSNHSAGFLTGTRQNTFVSATASFSVL